MVLLRARHRLCPCCDQMVWNIFAGRLQVATAERDRQENWAVEDYLFDPYLLNAELTTLSGETADQQSPNQPPEAAQQGSAGKKRGRAKRAKVCCRVPGTCGCRIS